MVSITHAYVIVDGNDDILLSTMASNKSAAWQGFMERANYRVIYKNVADAKRCGFKCVRVNIRTEEYRR